MTFGLKGSGTNSLIVNSREATTNKPQLVINGGGTPPPTTPVGAFNAVPSSGTAPLTVTFTDQSTNTPTAWAWNFGDPGSGAQNTSTAQNPTPHLRVGRQLHRDAHTQQRRGARTSATRMINVSTPGGGGHPVLVGAGDIADCSRTTDEATAVLLDGIAGTVFAAGDNAYPDGSTANYNELLRPDVGAPQGTDAPSRRQPRIQPRAVLRATSTTSGQSRAIRQGLVQL